MFNIRKLMKTFYILLFFILIYGLTNLYAKTKITWWAEQAEPHSTELILKLIVDKFNAEHPNLELELIEQPNADVLRPALMAGAGPDIMWCAGNAACSEYYAAGHLLALDKYSKEFGWNNKLMPWAYNAGIINNKLYTLPQTFETFILMYNTKVFKKNGWEPPTTGSQLWSLAEKMKQKGIIPFAYGNASWKPTNEHLAGIYLNNYAGPENVYKALIGEKPWSDKEFVGAMNLLKEHIVDKGYFMGSIENYYSYGWNEMWPPFASGEAGMMMIGTWGFRGGPSFFKDNPDDWDWVPLPPFSSEANSQIGPYHYDLALGGNIAINRASQNADEAALVLDFILNDKKSVLEIAASSNFGEWVIPLKYSLSDFPATTDKRVLKYFNDFTKVTSEGRYGYTTWTFWPAKSNVQLWKELELLWASEMTTEEYLQNHENTWKSDRAEGKTFSIPNR